MTPRTFTPETVTMNDTPENIDTPRKGVPKPRASALAARQARPHLWELFDNHLRDHPQVRGSVEQAEENAGMPQNTLRLWLKTSAPRNKVPDAVRIAEIHTIFTWHGANVTVEQVSNALALDGNYKFALALTQDEIDLLHAYRASRDWQRPILRFVRSLCRIGTVHTRTQWTRAVEEAFDTT